MSNILRPLNRHVKAELAEAVDHFHRALPNSAGWEYLAGRGIGAATARRLRLGYVDPQDPREGWERFRGRICIPYLNQKGDAVWAKFRATPYNGPEAPKMAQQAGSEARLYNTIALSAPGDTLCLVEGEFDAITLTALGIPAVGVPGTGAWKTHFHRALQGWDRMVLFYDNDQNEAGDKLVKSVKAHLPDVIPLAAPGGFNDVSAAFEAGHGEAIKALAYGYELEKEHGQPQEVAHEHHGDAGGSADERPSEPAGDGEPINRYDGISNPDAEPPF